MGTSDSGRRRLMSLHFRGGRAASRSYSTPVRPSALAPWRRDDIPSKPADNCAHRSIPDIQSGSRSTINALQVTDPVRDDEANAGADQRAKGDLPGAPRRLLSAERRTCGKGK